MKDFPKDFSDVKEFHEFLSHAKTKAGYEATPPQAEDAFHLDAMLTMFEAVCSKHGEDPMDYISYRVAMAYHCDRAEWEDANNAPPNSDDAMVRYMNAVVGNEPKPYIVNNVVALRA